MADVEARVNDLVLADLAVHAEIMTQDEAVKSGAMALFGEKYGDEVRVVSVGDWARELCGGTHAVRSGQLGVIKLLGESSIGSGVRRVEALVGGDAYRFLAREHVLVAQLSEALKVRPEELPERVNDIVEKLRAAEKEIEKVRVQPAARRGRPARRRRAATSPASRSSPTGPTAPAAATCASSRSTSAAGCPPGSPAWWSSSATADGKVVGRGGGQRRGPRARPQRQRAGRRDRPAASAAAAAARTTSPRAAAATPPAIDEALALVGDRGRPRGRRVRHDLMRHGVRLGHRPRGRPDRRRAQRPLRVPRDPGRDACARGKGDLARIARAGRGGGGRRGRRRAAPLAVRRRGPGGGQGAGVRRPAGRAGRAGAGAAGRRASDHGFGGGYAARPGEEGSAAPRRRRPGRRGDDPAARTGHRTCHGSAPGEPVERDG